MHSTIDRNQFEEAKAVLEDKFPGCYGKLIDCHKIISDGRSYTGSDVEDLEIVYKNIWASMEYVDFIKNEKDEEKRNQLCFDLMNEYNLVAQNQDVRRGR